MSVTVAGNANEPLLESGQDEGDIPVIMKLYKSREIVVYELGHTNSVRKVSCDRLLWLGERDAVYPSVEICKLRLSNFW